MRKLSRHTRESSWCTTTRGYCGEAAGRAAAVSIALSADKRASDRSRKVVVIDVHRGGNQETGN